MRKFDQLCSFVLMAIALCVAPAAFAETKIAVIDMQSAVLNSDEAKRFLDQIQNEFKGQEQEIRDLQSEAAALLERLQKDGSVMSETESRKLQQQIETKNNDFVYLRQKLQKQVEDRRNELFAGIDQKVQAAIEEIVKSGDYDLILRREAALYVSPVYDITRRVTEQLNALNKAAKPKP